MRKIRSKKRPLDERCAELKARLRLKAPPSPPAQKPAPDLQGPLRKIVATLLQNTDYTKVHTATPLEVDSKGRERIPDVLVLRKQREDRRLFEKVPILIIEIKTPDDTFDDIVNSCIDYERLMVFNILVMDPDNGRVWLFSRGSLRLVDGPSVELPIDHNQTIVLPFVAMFGELHYRFDWRTPESTVSEPPQLERLGVSNDD